MNPRAFDSLDWRHDNKVLTDLCDSVLTMFAQRDGIPRRQLAKVLKPHSLRREVRLAAERFGGRRIGLLPYVYLNIRFTALPDALLRHWMRGGTQVRSGSPSQSALRTCVLSCLSGLRGRRMRVPSDEFWRGLERCLKGQGQLAPRGKEKASDRKSKKKERSAIKSRVQRKK